ncbi:hypothetical protein [Spirosoma oryzicola]|uniref:hypothetical protein n=1 Tax=Spirosoma oryzicola TaxID=2898794 RepID=UPI001E2B7821|nr:hypothetical protein [Spirosoma oryzicola]UHG93426.1 hypothetical protein LQ777_11090 [Spirosoma oryzicola]
MKNTIRQNVTTLDLVLFRGNQLHLLVTLPDDFVMPTAVRWKFSNGGGLFSSVEQPTVTVTGKTIDLVLDTTNLPERGVSHTLYFDNRAVLAGGVVTNRQTTNAPAYSDQHVPLTIDAVIPINVQMITTVLDSSGEVAPDLASIYELFKQA